MRTIPGICVLLTAAICGLVGGCNEPEKPSGANQITVNPGASPSVNGSNEDPSVALDKSPMDMSYYPVEYTKEKMIGRSSEPLVARVIYSRPKKDNRVIFGDVLKYGAPWRLGANEATEIEFFSNVSINNQAISKGRYVIYCLPYPDKWQIRLNTDLYTWGLKIDSAKDAYRFDVAVKKAPVTFERFTMEFEKAPKGMELHIAWDTLYASVPILY
ncbi:MAG: DUF2911 domain-containing protein [Sphingobacteriales bacterium]|nr:MAG: DUF2911 domain-containing protein [Sphingobacteriales bacterium]